MIPIYLHGSTGKRGYMFDDFVTNLVRICTEHQDANRACAFAFIVYDMRRPWVNRVLDDSTYFSALDKTSGNVLSVFSVHDGLLRQGSMSRDDSIHSAREVESKSQEFLDRHFGLSVVKTPAVVFFEVSNGSVQRYVSFELEASGTEQAFGELQELLNACAECVRDSIGRRVSNPDLAFSKLQREISKKKLRGMVASAFGKFTSVKEFMGLFSST